MAGSLLNSSTVLSSRVLNAWFDELVLPVAPACNMMCNFCSRCSDCVCNANDPENTSRPMTPRQAANWAVSSVKKNRRIKSIKITGPGEPLFNCQTFEVLKRLNNELEDFVLGINTNGLLLNDRAGELLRLNVSMVEVSVNAIYTGTISKLYSRIILGSDIITGAGQLAHALTSGQFGGIRQCVENGMNVKVNTIYFPGINDEDILSIAVKCRELGVQSMRIISCYPGGKFSRMRTARLEELEAIRREVSGIIREVEVKGMNL